jgi:predicted O-linked N-acetylglucosamine transferase (SPINDLY family)
MSRLRAKAKRAGARSGRAARAGPAAAEVAAQFAQALALHQAARLGEAEALYRGILERDAGHFDARHHLGIIHYQRGEHIAAIRQFDAALQLNATVAAAHNNRGVALAALARLDEAAESYGRAIALKPDYVDALFNRGNAFKELQRFDAALESYDRAIALASDHVFAWIKRGNALHELQRYEEAVASYDRAIALKPDLGEAFNNRAATLAKLERFEQALEGYDRAIALKPDHAEAYSNRGFVLRDMKRPDEALASFARALALKPDFAYLRGTHLGAKMQVCDWSDFDHDCAEVLAAVDDGKAAALPFQLLATPASPAQQRRCAERYGADAGRTSQTPLWRGERYVHDRIRIAYLSADLRDHPIAALTAGLFARHDRARFETVAISFKSDAHNDVRERLSGLFDRFIDAQRMSDRDVARLVRELEIDIAIDLNGHTEGARSDVFAWRPAPVQVNYLGYAGTLGQPAWDYILADRFVVPATERAYYAEQVVDLPNCFMVNDRGRRISEPTPSRAEAGLPTQGFVFCGFNNSFKITPNVFDVWMRLLGGVDGSVLWLSAAHASVVANLRREAERRGVAGDRLVFAPRVTLNADHLARLRLADLFVDTLNYNAHVTAADALWAGVPVLTCPGATFASRVAGSLLHAVGLPELVASSLGEYEALALGLARDPDRLAALRHRLARNRDVYPLFDTDRFTRHIEVAYTAMWERAQRGEPPCSFAVAGEDRIPG